MRIIFLNTWNGKIKDGITKFIRDYSHDTDLFCFQEAVDAVKFICRSVMPGYKEISAYKYVAEDEDFSQATYIGDKIIVLSSGKVLENQKNAGLGIYLQIQFGDSAVHICNFHGLAHPGDKLDNPDRIKQSQGLIDFFKDKSGPKVIGGDFNLFPDTDSIKMFQESSYRNLIGDFKIRNTRNKLAWERFPNSKQYYSDYIFVTPDINIKSFSVPNIEISDHLPLILDIEL